MFQQLNLSSPFMLQSDDMQPLTQSCLRTCCSSKQEVTLEFLEQIVHRWL